MTETAATETAATETEVSWELVHHQLTRLRKLYQRHINWHIAVTVHLRGESEAPSLSLMPSESAKGGMYDAAGWMTRYFVTEVPRATSLPGVAAVITAAEMKLSGLNKHY